MMIIQMESNTIIYTNLYHTVSLVYNILKMVDQDLEYNRTEQSIKSGKDLVCMRHFVIIRTLIQC